MIRFIDLLNLYGPIYLTSFSLLGNLFRVFEAVGRVLDRWLSTFADRQMIEIRPIWQSDVDLPRAEQSPINALFAIEKNTVKSVDLCVALANVFIADTEKPEVASLHHSAKVDLVAGCELARCGYLKQAYSLWRSWYEQSLFFIYFLEAPLHKAAWKVFGEVSLEDNPQYRLMLHQLLTDSGERHAFALVYNDRFTRMLDALKISQVSKANRPIQRATRVLTMLSQGVHGTYQPAPARSLDEACAQLERHCLTILEGATDSVLIFWLLLLTSHVDIPPEVLIRLREGAIDVSVIAETGLEEAERIAALAPLFKRGFAT